MVQFGVLRRIQVTLLAVFALAFAATPLAEAAEMSDYISDRHVISADLGGTVSDTPERPAPEQILDHVHHCDSCHVPLLDIRGEMTILRPAPEMRLRACSDDRAKPTDTDGPYRPPRT
ncbi:MAG: hypothetical protein KDA53_04035 [Hyphomonas sp.]|nr:hypothetical protein [Hyphomonas sp.]